MCGEKTKKTNSGGMSSFAVNAITLIPDDCIVLDPKSEFYALLNLLCKGETTIIVKGHL